MAQVPQTHYARADDGVHLAYQVVGDGPLDLVLIPGFVSHVEAAWDDPALARFYDRLASFSRLILFDKRGTGLSDRTDTLPDLDRRMNDLRAVLDAVGSEHAAFFGVSEGGPCAILFAATYPSRSCALVLYGSYARFLRDDDYPWGLDEPGLEHFADWVQPRWGTGVALSAWAPSLKGDEAQRQLWGRLQRLAASPGAARALITSYASTDVRAALGSIQVPTLVLHRVDDRMIEIGAARHLAEHIAGARLVELPGADHFYWTGDQDAIIAEVEEFLTGARPARQPDRSLATVLFTDIVGSTARAAQLGDRRWLGLLEQHDRLVERQVARFGGRVVQHIGDGLLATFDGPARAIRCAHAIVDGAAALGLELRAGLHTGEIELRGEDVAGIAVHIAERVSAVAPGGEILVSRTVVDLVVGSGLEFADRGEHELKGVPGTWRLFAVQT